MATFEKNVKNQKMRRLSAVKSIYSLILLAILVASIIPGSRAESSGITQENQFSKVFSLGQTYSLMKDVSINIGRIDYVEGRSDNQIKIKFMKESGSGLFSQVYNLKEGGSIVFEGISFSVIRIGKTSIIGTYYESKAVAPNNAVPFKVALGDDAPPSDILISTDVVAELQNLNLIDSGLGDGGTGVAVLFSNLNGFDLDNKVTLAIYNGKAVIITGSNSPSSHSAFSKTLRRLLEDRSIPILKSIKSKDITQKNIRYLFGQVPSIGCTDSDGGVNYAVKGTCTSTHPLGAGPNSDYCMSDGTLVEYSCTKDTSSGQYAGMFRCSGAAGIICSSGTSCVDGACVADIIPNPSGQGTWTQWFNRDDSSGTGDWEHKQNFPDVCEKPIAIECKTLDGTDFMDAGQDVICNTAEGLVCYNNLNDNQCKDYKVRFLCPVQDAAPKSPQQIRCVDNDGGMNENIRSTIKGLAAWGPGLQAEVLKDHCRLPDYANEFYCNDAGYVDQKSIFCENGCSDGVCLGSFEVIGLLNVGKNFDAYVGQKFIYPNVLEIRILEITPAFWNPDSSGSSSATVEVTILNDAAEAAPINYVLNPGGTVSIAKGYSLYLKEIEADESGPKAELVFLSSISTPNPSSIYVKLGEDFKLNEGQKANINYVAEVTLLDAHNDVFSDALPWVDIIAVPLTDVGIDSGSSGQMGNPTASGAPQSIQGDLLVPDSKHRYSVTLNSVLTLSNGVVIKVEDIDNNRAKFRAYGVTSDPVPVPSTIIQGFYDTKMSIKPGYTVLYGDDVKIYYNSYDEDGCRSLENGEQRSDVAVDSVSSRNKNCRNGEADFTISYKTKETQKSQRIIIPQDGEYDIDVAWYDTAGTSKINALIINPERENSKKSVSLGEFKGDNNFVDKTVSLGRLKKGSEIIISITTEWWGKWYPTAYSTDSKFFNIKQSEETFEIYGDDGVKYDGGYNDVLIYIRPVGTKTVTVYYEGYPVKSADVAASTDLPDMPVTNDDSGSEDVSSQPALSAGTSETAEAARTADKSREIEYKLPYRDDSEDSSRDFQSGSVSSSSSSLPSAEKISTSCFNGRLDKGEEDIDCGGRCGSCVSSSGQSTYKTIRTSLENGDTYRFGNYVLSLVSLSSDGDATIVVQLSISADDDSEDKPIVIGDEYGYICATGCKEVEDGCLCPKIKVLRSSSGFRIESSTGSPILADSIEIAPGSDTIKAKLEGRSDLDIGAKDLDEGVEFEIDDGKKVKILTDKEDLVTFFSDSEIYAKTRAKIEIESASGLTVETKEGSKEEINILPSEAAEKAARALNADYTNMELKEADDRIKYEVKARQKYRVLGLIPAEGDIVTGVDAQSGEILGTNSPWYASISSKVKAED